jgi:hypothetical protein
MWREPLPGNTGENSESHKPVHVKAYGVTTKTRLAARLETLRSRAKCRKLTVAPPEAPA